MRAIVLKLFLILILGSSSVFGQGPQNRELTFLAGPLRSTTQMIPGSSVAVSTSTGLIFENSIGDQVLSTSAGALYVEVPVVWIFPGESVALGATGSRHLMGNFVTPGIRFKIPLQSRVSAYGILGGGYGVFRRYELATDASNGLLVQAVGRWVFDFGGGADVRLSRPFSLRVEVRDFVGGRGLSGVDGRHHVIALGGIALHF